MTLSDRQATHLLVVPFLPALILLGLTTVIYAFLYPFYPGNFLSLLIFVISTALLIVSVVSLHPSFFTVVVGGFLTIGFLVKAIAHLTFGAALIEPTGPFAELPAQWDKGIGYAAAGHFGAVAAVVIASFITVGKRKRTNVSPTGNKLPYILCAALFLLVVVAFGVYAVNYRFTILRIGYPLGVDIDPRLYAMLAFILTWGALLGAFALTHWLIDLHRLRHSSFIVVASVLGFLASFTMGSRVQFLLYLLAAFATILVCWKQIQHWRGVAVATIVAGILFMVSVGLVSIERNYDFRTETLALPAPASTQAAVSAPVNADNPASVASTVKAATMPSYTPDVSATPQPEGATLADKIQAASSTHRLAAILAELRSLFVMRWVGLEGVLTTASSEPALGSTLFRRSLAEDPAAGTNGIYQKMSGDRYGNVKNFTFLTLPGIIGVASYSGSYLTTFAFVLAVLLVLHVLEVAARRATDNIAVAAVSGVSLAYLTVQMGFPWTLLIYAVELGIAAALLGLCWFLARRLTSNTSAD